MIFVDTSAFIALNVQSDAFHKLAIGWWQKNKGTKIATSNFVIAETLSWLRYVVGKEKAVEVGRYLFESPDIKKVSVNIIDEQNAWELFQKLSGKGISFVDCLSFALMQRLKIKTAFTFDADFTRAGFDSLPK